MELSPRKQAVLKAIIKAYIETGEPIGSKNLTALLENAPSSATLRNEMSELCELGLLSQPHTSAGRIPTEKGYRLYVDSLMTHKELNGQEKEYIDCGLDELTCEPEGIPAAAAQLLSRLTELPVIACLITNHSPKIKRVELVPIGRHSAMLLVITDDGRTRNRIFRYSKEPSREQMECFIELIEKRIKRKNVSELTKAYMQNVIAEAGLYALELMPILTAVFETAAEINISGITLRNEKALYNVCGSETAASRVISLIKQGDPIISLLEGIDNNVGAVFGADTGYSELEKGTIIAAKFSITDKYKGYIAVIGPNRMSYDRVMPAAEYTAKKLTEIMTEAQKDMED